MARLAVAAGLVLSMVALIHWISPPNVQFPLAPGQLYDAPVCENTCIFELPFADPREQYLLVVANLADQPKPCQLALSAAAVAHPQASTLRAIEPVRHRLLPKPRIESPAQPQPDSWVAAPTRRFWLHMSSGSPDNPAAYVPIDTVLSGEGGQVRVYTDRSDRIAPETVAFMVDRFDGGVLPVMRRFLGTPDDVDGDGKFAVVVTPALDRLCDGRMSLGGMVWARDFDRRYEAPFGNQADCLYLNASVRSGRHLETLLAHELAHAVTTSGRLRAASAWVVPTEDDAWLNEAISHVAENLYSDNWSNLDYRLAAFLESPSESPLVVPNYEAHGLSQAPGPRGATYLFLRWCVEQFGTHLLMELAHSPRRGPNSLEAATGQRLSELYRQFAAELFLPKETTAARTHLGRNTGRPLASSYGQVGRHVLFGPRFTNWRVDEPGELTHSLAGTSACYFVLSSSQPGRTRISIEATAPAELQVTLVRLENDRPRLAVELVPYGQNTWRLQIRLEQGAGVRLTHAAIDEGSVPTSRGRGGFEWQFAGNDLARLLPCHELAAGDVVLSEPFELPTAQLLRARILGQDRAGQPVAAWTQTATTSLPLRMARRR
jgi:hypothetical protein